MLRKVAMAVLAPAVLLAAACGPRMPAPTVNETMTQVMEPEAQTIWDVTSHAFNDRGDGLEASKLTAADWAELEKAGRRMQDQALALAKDRHVKAVAPGEHILGGDASGQRGDIGKEWDAASARKVQAMIDADPALFAERARILAQAGATVAQASRDRNAQTLYGVSSNLDEVCDGCHEKFWGTDLPPPFPKK